MITFLEILGSLGVFLYGMKVLSEGVQKFAGQRMRYVMATMTQNRASGLFTGFLITCLLQSSSATTVIVVSFVNAGLLTLVESIGVVMGANLGTTVTAWIIAAVGKFSLAKVALPIVGIGLPLFFIGKGRFKGFGEATIGFGLLFFGLGLLKEAVPDVSGMLASDDAGLRAHAEYFSGIIKSISGHGYLSYLSFLCIGIVLTLVVQSSSAAMAVTVTLAMNGWITFEDSAFIVLGENIGTTVTAWLAALGADYNAKRAARAHFLFNVLGVLWMLAIFPYFSQLVLWISGLMPESLRTAKHTSNIGFSLAIFHTLFNFINICLLIGFVPLIAKIVSRWIPEPQAIPGRRHHLTYITQNLVNTGELNLPEAEKATIELADLTRNMYNGFIEVYKNPETNLSDQVQELRAMEDEADEMTEEITEYLVRCSAAEIGQQNATAVAQMIRMVAELEIITDHIFRLVKFTQRKYRKSQKKKLQSDEQPTPAETEGTEEYFELIKKYIEFYNEMMFHPISDEDMQMAQSFEDEIDNRCKKLNRLAMQRMSIPDSDIKSELLQIEFNNHCEKIGNNALNVIQSLQHLSDSEENPKRIAAEVDKIATSAKIFHNKTNHPDK